MNKDIKEIIFGSDCTDFISSKEALKSIREARKKIKMSTEEIAQYLSNKTGLHIESSIEHPKTQKNIIKRQNKELENKYKKIILRNAHIIKDYINNSCIAQ